MISRLQTAVKSCQHGLFLKNISTGCQHTWQEEWRDLKLVWYFPEVQSCRLPKIRLFFKSVSQTTLSINDSGNCITNDLNMRLVFYVLGDDWTPSSQENGHLLQKPFLLRNLSKIPGEIATFENEYAEPLRMHHFLEGPLSGWRMETSQEGRAVRNGTLSGRDQVKGGVGVSCEKWTQSGRDPLRRSTQSERDLVNEGYPVRKKPCQEGYPPKRAILSDGAYSGKRTLSWGWFCQEGTL